MSNQANPLFLSVEFDLTEEETVEMTAHTNNILFGLSNIGFEFDADILETLDAIEELITEDADLKQVVLYVIHNFTK